MPLPQRKRLALSGERFTAVYRFRGDEPTVRRRCEDVCIEQTVEFPAALLPAGEIAEQLVGRIESFEPADDELFEVEISYPVELAGRELVTLLGVLHGMVSHQPDVGLERIALPDSLLAQHGGPRFGAAGWRERTGVFDRPLVCTAVKPVGLDARELAGLAHDFALGGIDLVKDDHGLLDQPFAPFRERVLRCVEAVDRANRQTGGSTLYLPHVSGPAEELIERAGLAREAGAGGLLVAPGLVGLDGLRRLAADPAVGLPLVAHPTWVGGWLPLGRGGGISDFALYGQLMRLAGADAVIFLGFGGRFDDSQETSRRTVQGCRAPMGPLLSALPVVGGGMQLERMPDLLEFYGSETIFLVGGGLHTAGPDLVENCRAFRRLVEACPVR